MSKQESTINTGITVSPSLGEALFGFYRHSMYVFLRPSPASFAEVASNTRWAAVWLQITFMTVITGLLAFLWGRVSLFTSATATTRPLPFISALIVTFVVPVMFFIIGVITYAIANSLKGKGTFLAQTYTTLMIFMPLFILSFIVVIVSLHLPVLGSILAVIDFLLLIYGVVLQIFSMMAVHNIGPWKATLIVLLQTVAIIAVVLVIAFVFFIASSDSNSNNSSGSSSGKSGGSKKTDTSSGESAGTVEAVDPYLYPAYSRYRVYPTYIPGSPQPTPANPATPVPGMQAPTVELAEASCPTCYYTEWAGPERVNNQLPCVHCGTQMRPTSNSRQGEPPKGYLEMQCPQYHYHEWTAQHRVDAGVMCVHCGLKMQPTGNRW